MQTTTEKNKELTIEVGFQTKEEAAAAKNAVAYLFLYAAAKQAQSALIHETPPVEECAPSVLKVYEMLETIEFELHT